MSSRYEIRPGLTGRQRRATHAEVLAALKTCAKHLGLVPKLPAGKHGDHWRASIDGLTVHGDTRNFDGDRYEVFWIDGDCERDTLLAFAGELAALLGRQAVIGETDDEFWFVDKPTPKSKTKRKRT